MVICQFAFLLIHLNVNTTNQQTHKISKNQRIEFDWWTIHVIKDFIFVSSQLIRIHSKLETNGNILGKRKSAVDISLPHSLLFCVLCAREMLPLYIFLFVLFSSFQCKKISFAILIVAESFRNDDFCTKLWMCTNRSYNRYKYEVLHWYRVLYRWSACNSPVNFPRAAFNSYGNYNMCIVWAAFLMLDRYFLSTRSLTLRKPKFLLIVHIVDMRTI